MGNIVAADAMQEVCVCVGGGAVAAGDEQHEPRRTDGRARARRLRRVHGVPGAVLLRSTPCTEKKAAASLAVAMR
jgi:hypothetical protein